MLFEPSSKTGAAVPKAGATTSDEVHWNDEVVSLKADQGLFEFEMIRLSGWQEFQGTQREEHLHRRRNPGAVYLVQKRRHQGTGKLPHQSIELTRQHRPRHPVSHTKRHRKP